jgi:alpha-D-ribose 1-methylphosphonate 5-triphosphate synthase subunit PhnG
MDGSSDPNAARKAWLSVLAKAQPQQVAALWQTAGIDAPHEVLRPPEIGAVMVRGRAGAVGAAFNLGEMTVTRASVRLDTGEVGHGYVQGRDKTHAHRAAMVDALMQTDRGTAIEAAIVAPLRTAAETVRATRTAKAAATKVDFFTMVRGED